MKRGISAFIFLISFLKASAGNPKINYEWFSLGGNFIYSIEDGYTGLNGKLLLAFDRSVHIVFQGTLFPAQMQLGEETFDEIRSKVNVQFTPFRFGDLNIYVHAGFDNGMWRRNFSILESQLGNQWKVDESMMFGGGLNYDVKSVRFYADWMYMPQIYSNHVGLGMKILFFESKLYRRFYLQRKRRHSVVNWKWPFKLPKKNTKL